MSGTEAEILRYERKFFVTGLSLKEVELQIKLHPFNFRPVYHQRRINNIYLDTPGFDYYHDNVNGEKHRLKARIRWYGELYGFVNKPVLEFKVKEGLLGKKDSYPLGGFSFQPGFEYSSFEAAYASLSKRVQDHMRSLKPVIVNSYSRKYFLSFDKKYRITIDWDLKFIGITDRSPLLNKSEDHSAIVVELKYNAEDDEQARDIPAFFSFPLTKSSKYLQAIERTCF